MTLIRRSPLSKVKAALMLLYQQWLNCSDESTDSIDTYLQVFSVHCPCFSLTTSRQLFSKHQTGEQLTGDHQIVMLCFSLFYNIWVFSVVTFTLKADQFFRSVFWKWIENKHKHSTQHLLSFIVCALLKFKQASPQLFTTNRLPLASVLCDWGDFTLIWFEGDGSHLLKV